MLAARVGRLCVVIVLLTDISCGQQVYVSQQQLEKDVDQVFGSQLHAEHPGVVAGKARCATALVASTVNCLLPLTVGELRIRAWRYRDQGVKMRTQNVLVPADRADRQIEAQLLRRYGLRATARCMPSLQLAEVGSRIRCSLTTRVSGLKRVDAVVTRYHGGVGGSGGVTILPSLGWVTSESLVR